LGVVVRTYKAAVTTSARNAGFGAPIWQRGYYERVIRSDVELERLVAYTEENPLGWDRDEENIRRRS